MHSTVGAFFLDHLDVVYFFYGLAFFAMGIALATFIRRKSRFKIAHVSWCLALFGLTHGLKEWCDMLLLSGRGGAVVSAIAFGLLLVSYIFLFEYGRRLLTLDLNRAPKLIGKFSQVNGVWITVSAVAAALVPALLSADFLLTGTVLTRYFVGLPADLLCMLGSIVYYRSERDILDSIRAKKYFYGGAAVFACYAVFGGLIVPAAGFLPASALNDGAFLRAFSVPVQVFRTICAFGMLWSSVGILKIFHWEQLRGTSLAENEILLLKQQMEFILGATHTGLDIIDSEYNVRYVDPAWQKVYGPYQGKKCYEYFMGRSDPCPRCGVREALKSKKPVVTEEVMPMEGNRPIQVTTIPFKSHSGEWLVAEVNVDISERKRAEEALRSSEERYRLVFDMAADPIAVVDESGTFLMINRTAATYLRSTPESCVGKTMWDLFSKADADRQMASIREVIRSGSGSVFESKSAVAGAARWFNTRIHPLAMGDQGRKCALIIARDVTEHKAADQEIRKFKMIADNAAYGIGIVDMQGRVIYSNECFAEAHGYSAGELLGRDISVFHAEEQMSEVRRINNGLLTSGAFAGVEVLHKKRDGSVFPMLMSGVLVRDEADKPLFIAATAIDITERKKVEEALKGSDERYRTLVDNIGIGVALISPGMEILAMNNQMQQWFPNVDVGKRPICYKSFNVPPSDAVCSYCPTRLTLDDGKVHEAITDAVVSATARNFRIVSTPLFDNDGAVTGAIEMVEDITERKRAEEALRESEQVVRGIIDNSPAVIFMKDLEGRYLLINSLYEKLFHVSNDALKGKTDREVFPAEVAEALRKADSAVLKAGRPLEFEEVVPQDDGLHDYLSLKFPLFNAQGKAYAVCGIATDFTERKKAQAALGQSRQQYFDLVEGANSVILKMDREGRVTYWNKFAAEFLGFLPEEIVGKSVVGTIVPAVESDGRDLRKMIDDLCADPVRFRNNLNENMKKSGERVWISWTNQPILDDNGRAVGVLCVGNDVTERRKAEAALLKSEARYHVLVDAATAAIVQIDLKGKITFWSKFAEQFFGYETAEVLGRSVFGTIVPPVDQAGRDLVEMIDDVCREPERFWHNENENMKKNGERVWVSWSNRPLYGDDGAFTGILCIGVDISERKRAEAALQKAYADLQDMQHALVQTEKLAALGRFSLGVAHEVKNPLGIILGNLEYLGLKITGADGDVREALQTMEQATVRADAIVRNLLRFARPTELKLEKVPLCVLVDEMVDFLKYRAPLNNITLTIKHATRDRFVTGDKNQLQQVLFNLLMNAVEALPPDGGSIQVKTDVRTESAPGGDEPRCVIEVIDTGCGITSANQKRLFEPFFTTKRDQKGTGLGLPVSKTIVEKHKGSISIESIEGKGTTVRVTLPVA
ncbi:MAG TPA: PAS domain S-box protein [bacterium]|nr:PAS domain S-box protein [bacterium]